jgi:hypothetical protein
MRVPSASACQRGEAIVLKKIAFIAYLSTLDPIENDVPDHQLNFPLSLIVNAIPREAELRNVNRDDPVEYGEYLSQLAGCTWCHTPINATQQTIPEQLLAGGHEFAMGASVVRAANISPDPETGIGNWALEQFIARFREYQGDGARTTPVGEDGFNTLMS